MLGDAPIMGSKMADAMAPTVMEHFIGTSSLDWHVRTGISAFQEVRRRNLEKSDC
jgi:hypothetical protein